MRPPKSFLNLFASFVDLGKESLEDSLLETLALVNVGDHLADLTSAPLLKLFVTLLELHVVIQLLDDLLLLIVLLAIVLLENLALLRGSDLQSLVDQPGALVVLDISADLANVLGQTEVVKVVVLDLEVLAKRNEDILGLLQVLGGGDVEDVERQNDGEVEGVVGGLVDDNEAVLVHGEVVEVDSLLGGGEQVTQLAQLGLNGGLVEELNEVDVGGVRAEVLLEEGVDGRLQHEGIVDGNHANTVLAVPARLTTAGDAAVHDIVGDEEEGLEQLRHPAKSGSLEVLVLGQRGIEKQGDGVGNGHASVALATKSVDLETLWKRQC